MKGTPPVGPSVERRWARVADDALRWATELPAALLVVAELALLLAGVVSRYAFHRPLYWVDELATVLLLWLGMLGAAVALRRGEHMRLTAFVRGASPATRAFVDVVVLVVIAAFALLLLGPTRAFVAAELDVTMPALDLPAGYGFAAVPVGLVLMLAVALVRLASVASRRSLLAAVALVGMVAAAAALARPLLVPLGNLNLVLFFAVLVAILVGASVPVAFGFGVATLSYLSLTTSMPLQVVVGRMAEGMSALVLLAVPLFVLLGYLIEMTGITHALIELIAALVGHLRGGLGYVLLAAMYVVSGISGAKAADMAAVAPVLFPEMKERGWEPGELAGLLSASAAMGETIPPSLVVILIGSVTGVSIAALFTGGLMPAAVAALSLASLVFLRSRRMEAGVRRAPPREVLRKALAALPALALPVIVLGAVVLGIATDT